MSIASTVSCQDAVGVRWLFAVGNQRNSAGSDMGSSFADCAWTASRRTAQCVKDPVSTPDDRGARTHAGTHPGTGPGRVRHHRAAAGDLAPLTDSLWLVIDDTHELGPLRQLELLLMLARRSGKLTEF
jgi:hypothetical protein